MTYDLQHAVERIRELEEKLEKAEARVDEYNQNYERAALECIKLQARVKELEDPYPLGRHNEEALGEEP